MIPALSNRDYIYQPSLPNAYDLILQRNIEEVRNYLQTHPHMDVTSPEKTPGDSVLFWAVDSNQKELVAAVLTHGKTRNKAVVLQACKFAIDSDKAEAVEAFLESDKFDLGELDIINGGRVGITLINLAIKKLGKCNYKRSESIVVSLINRNTFQINIQDLRGNTPLHTAAFYGNAKVIDALVRAGALRQSVNKYGQTPLKRYQTHNTGNPNPDIIKILL